ncbi:MAG: hypothetical protein WD066_11255 [Planctomycetaceae bacterium]
MASKTPFGCGFAALADHGAGVANGVGVPEFGPPGRKDFEKHWRRRKIADIIE